MFFKKCYIIVLGSQHTTENNEFTSLQYVWLIKLLSVINHATEDLQWRLLILQIWFVRSTMPRMIYSIEYQTTPNIACCTATCKWKERKDSNGGGNSTEQEESKKQKSNGNPGWHNEDDGWILDTSNSFIVTCLHLLHTRVLSLA